MKKDILYFQWICILMLVSGLLWVAAGSLPLFLWEEEIAEGLVESRIIGFFMMAQAVFSEVCCFAGMQAVRKKRTVSSVHYAWHRCFSRCIDQ